MKDKIIAVIAIIAGYGLAIFLTWVSCMESASKVNIPEQPEVTVTSPYSKYFPEWEVTEIMDACYRNDLEPQLIPIVYAIRKAENGITKPFGIMNPEADTYSKQAGWCACTVQNNYDRWLKDNEGKEFIDFLADRYCPAETDPVGNANWKRNVRYWTNKFIEGK